MVCLGFCGVEDSKAGKVGSIESAVPGEEAVGLGKGVSGDQELRQDAGIDRRDHTASALPRKEVIRSSVERPSFRMP